MIGAFARMLGKRERILAYEETPDTGISVQARHDAGEDTTSEGRDAPPEAFVEKVPHEGGDVYVSPMLEMLRRTLRRRRDEQPSVDPTLSRPPENPEAPSEEPE